MTRREAATPQMPFGVSLTRDDLDRLNAHATRMDFSRSALARAIIQQWLDDHDAGVPVVVEPTPSDDTAAMIHA